MITILNDSVDPYFNLAFEEHIFSNYRDNDVFLLWRNSPAIIVGSYQNILREVHMRKLLELGIPVLRRISGGGTVYHDSGNLNYTYITDSDGSVDYEKCMAPIIDALNRLGVSAVKSGVCEITVNGLKVSGSAQRVVKGRVLHHGTLLFDSDLELLDSLTTGRKNDNFVSRGTVSAICKVTNISQHMDEKITVDEFKNRLLDLLVPSEDRYELSDREIETVRKNADEKYRSWKWTWGAAPQFTYEKSGIFRNKPVKISYRSKKGILSEVKIESPFDDINSITDLLEGSELDPIRIIKICESISEEDKDELADLFM